jgi:hypothetical protein
LSQGEAADILLEFLEDARTMKEHLRVAMEENPAGEFPLIVLQWNVTECYLSWTLERNWYPELLEEQFDANQATAGATR